MDRTQRLLRSLTKSARIIEIGPSFSPLAPKRDGWNTLVVDHASHEELLAKYADQDIAQIEEVDCVWKGGSIADALPADQHGTFDAFIASHVIEHTTDIVTFLQAAQTLIKPNGIIILAVPDKRKCFDFYRHLSSTADAIEAFYQRRDRHSARTHIDYALNMAHKPNGEGAWHGEDTRPVVPVSSVIDEPNWRLAAGLPDYTDAHAWVFVPASFQLMILELAAAGYIDLCVEEAAEAEATEFYAWLRKGRETLPQSDLQAMRKQLMDRVIIELAEQSRQIIGSPLNRLQFAENTVARLVEAESRIEAMQTVLEAIRGSTNWRGLNRRKFQNLIAEASRSVPSTGSAAVQHIVLLAEARRMLGTPALFEGGKIKAGEF
ncbi:class I SAM-dependent methyltransferase [Methylobacterium sp. E-065]|uniref:methyltransferase domain-containing protein n=1 Tax=Methylobacterium sp. E-065 TaxID=2836583 RepID=UPI001FBAEF40|nr:methyltransferase domain-containing protein [Methylobacterium sp. E-065]MCJ2022357.1 class I SAM-dependent methyltransferase [Methylobacterium sp. E-065]